MQKSTRQTKIFIVTVFGLGILTMALMAYCYVWFDTHRSGRQISTEDVDS